MVLNDLFFFFKQKTAYEFRLSLVGSEMCIKDRSLPSLHVPRLWKGHAFSPLPASAELERGRPLPFPFGGPGALGDVGFPSVPC